MPRTKKFGLPETANVLRDEGITDDDLSISDDDFLISSELLFLPTGRIKAVVEEIMILMMKAFC